MTRIASRTIDDSQRTQICTLLSTGFSRREAARYAGCSESAIRYLAKHDPDFGQKLRAAEFAATSLPLESLRAAAGKSVRAAIYLDQRNERRRNTRRGTTSCIDPRRLCRRLYNRILGLIADPTTRSAVREALRDTYHSAGLKPPARDPELRAKPLPVYPADGDHWELQDYSPADNIDRSLASHQSRADSVPAAPTLPDSVPLPPSPTRSSAQSNTPPLPESPPSPYHEILPYKMAAVLSGLGEPRYTSLLMSELRGCKSICDLPDRVHARIADNLRSGRAPLAKGPRRKKNKHNKNRHCHHGHNHTEHIENGHRQNGHRQNEHCDHFHPQLQSLHAEP